MVSMPTRVALTAAATMAAALPLALLGGCSSQQLYGAGRAAQQHDCHQIADYDRRDRCLKDASMPLDTYQRQANPARPATNLDVAAWSGRWRGPEGTFLELTPNEGGYQVTVQNLDGPRQFQGRVVDDHIEFERDGRTEALRATDGPATGMKWLADKRNCLTIRPGEGFCRD